MKRIAIILLLMFSCSMIIQAQKTYSQENLEKLSQEELDVYLNKAMKLQKSGKTVTIIGGSILGATALTAVTFGSNMDLGVVVLGFFGGLAGVSTMAVGIPMKSTGKKRVERIEAIKANAFNEFKLEIKPSLQYNPYNQKYTPGVTLSVRF
ncbi:hypothetical protein ACUNWD_02085 [Sunxiuqinia sp. A32]|uniref:hypothetical protein n=1 Tax=Sunxiuqinia sp. A32 TaxID=3461496 RepID=UPI00404611BD